ncbi:Uncharacterized protein HZ326_22078 [Fusarium oxysporum f. sp. albedinis]|nr:Uncharacterized protein HZ326_22078 [Fusarium oxysporum f. sp. albedinis]
MSQHVPLSVGLAQTNSRPQPLVLTVWYPRRTFKCPESKAWERGSSYFQVGTTDTGNADIRRKVSWFGSFISGVLRTAVVAISVSVTNICCPWRGVAKVPFSERATFMPSFRRSSRELGIKPGVGWGNLG